MNYAFRAVPEGPLDDILCLIIQAFDDAFHRIQAIEAAGSGSTKFFSDRTQKATGGLGGETAVILSDSPISAAENLGQLQESVLRFSDSKLGGPQFAAKGLLPALAGNDLVQDAFFTQL